MILYSENLSVTILIITRSITEKTQEARRELNLLEFRLRVVKCFGSNTPIFPISFPTSISVFEEDTLNICLTIDKSYKSKHMFYGEDILPTFSSTSGIVVQNTREDFALLKIPTKGLLKNDQYSANFEYEFITRLPKPTGGYQEIPYKGEYQVIQNCR